MKNYMIKFYEPNPADGNGPTLADLDDPNFKPGDGTDKAADLAAEAEKQHLAAEELAKQNAGKEGVNPDGTLQDGYIKTDTGEIIKDPKTQAAVDDKKDDDANKGDDADASTFWEDVDKLRGAPLEVEYPDGVDPLSPEGAHIREKAVAAEAIVNFEEHLKKVDPRGYAYLLHRQAGGSDEEFYSTKTFSLPEYDTFKTDVDIQTRLYKASLISKGLDDEAAQTLVDKAIKDNKLFDLSDAAYKAAEKSHQKELDAIEKQTAAANKAYQDSTNALNAQLTTFIQEGKGMNLMIPDTDKVPFTNFVRSMVEYDAASGKYLFVQQIDGANMARQLEALYLLHKNGDLKSLIQRAAQTENKKRLGKVVDKSKTGGSGGSDGGGANDTKFVPLSDVV